MASGDSGRALDQDSLEKLSAAASPGKFLSQIHFVIEPTEEGANPVVAVCSVVYVRHGGFMLAIPNSDFLQEALMGLSLGDDVPAFRAVSVEVLTSRGKSLGVTDMLLVDLPWTAASAFCQPVSFRGAKFKDADQIRPEVNGQAGRPSRDQILAAADAWVGSGMDEDTAQEYLTGEEAPDQQFSEPYAPSEPRPAPADYQQLVKRVAELESRLTAAQQVPAAPPRSAAKAPPLFGAQTSPLDADQWNRIQKLAGSPAPRVGSVETRRSLVPAATDFQDHALATLEKEAEEDVLPADLSQLVASASDPLSQILAAQLQQNQLLMQRLLPKQQDPVLGALASSDNASGSGSNVKGCLAREAFQRTIQDLPRVAMLVQMNAMKELGFGPDRVDSSLMRRYVERRIPLQEFRLLSLVATMLAESWAIGYDAQDKLLMGSISRMLLFVEQTALDGGKTQLSWLLSGYPEPASHLLMSSRKKPGLEPFARLCPAPWVAANLSYLRDLDYMETRMAALGKPNRSKAALSDEEKDPKPKAKATPKAKGRGKGGGKQTAEPVETPAMG
jgi:hypothetical protein